VTTPEISQEIMNLNLTDAIQLARVILQRLPVEIKPTTIVEVSQSDMYALFEAKNANLTPDLTPDDTYKVADWEFYKKIIPYLNLLTSVDSIAQDINFYDCDKRAYFFCTLISYLYHINGQAKNQGQVSYKGQANGHAWCIVVALDSNNEKQLYLVDPYLGAYLDKPITNALNMDIRETHYSSSPVARFI
jgi:hypothetical protein